MFSLSDRTPRPAFICDEKSLSNSTFRLLLLLTNLSNNLRELRKRFKRTSTPGNLAALNDACEKLKKEVETATSNRTKQKLPDFNSAHHGNEVWKNFKKIFSNERDTMIAPLKPPKCKNGFCFTANEKTDVLMDTFSAENI